MSLALAGRFLTTGPPEKPAIKYLDCGGGCMKLHLQKIADNYTQWAAPLAQTVKSLQCTRPGFDLWIGKVP